MFNIVGHSLGSMLFIIHDTNKELLVHQSLISEDFSAGFPIVPSTNSNFFLVLNAFLRD